MLKLCLVGEGAIADIHAKSIAAMPDAAVTTLVCGNADDGEGFARKWGIPFATQDYRAALARPDVDAVIVASPSQLHSQQGLMALEAGKHVLVEIPFGTDIAGCRDLAAASVRSERLAMAAHTRRFSPAHIHLRNRMQANELSLQHLVAETFFFRRSNLNMLGKPRSWVDSLLWHHACHTIDLFVWLTGDTRPRAIAQAGPLHPELGIPMDMSIGLKAANGALLTLSLSFNNQGPFGGFYRYICDHGTYHVFRDELRDHERNPIAVEGSAFEDQNRHFVDAVSGRAPARSAIADCLPAMEIIEDIARQLATDR